MAAYAALVSLMNDLELIPAHPTHSFSFDHKQIASLLQTVHFLIHFMESYDSHGFSREAIEVLEGRIATVAHAAHDVIESHIVDQIHAGSTLLDGKARTSYFLLDLQKVIEDMDFVKEKATQVKAKRRLREEEEPTYSSKPLPSPKNVMVGIEAVAFQLMDMFIGGSPGQRVIPIVGMGGIGKTTLTKYVYDHLHIQHHFDVRLWATISHEYSAESILRELLTREKKVFGGNADELGEKLHKKLWGRRYLVVLDDMWSEGAWDKIRMFLLDDGTGSCVIVTTRLSNLATHLSSSPFEMNFLNEDKSWELFCRKAFGEKDRPAEVEEIGKKIVRRCRGLPLSIVVTGGHLRKSSRAIEYWEKIASYMNPISSIGPEDQCLNIISLSYHHLPPYLKPCFLYMGILEEDEQIDASQLLEYWVAEGFLKPKEAMSLEEVAEGYLKDLIDRNLIVVGTRKWNGKVKSCGIHDTVRELCLNVAKKEKFMCLIDDSTTAQNCMQSEQRRIVIPRGKKLNSNVIGVLKSAPLLRSLTYQLGQIDYNELRVELRLLRVSAYVNNEVRNEDGRDFPAASTQQANLRYLAFSSINYLITTQPLCHPSSISLFWNMQTLKMKNEFVTISAPYEIWGMPQLRSLEFTRGCLPDPIPNERCIVLQNLHTLIGVMNLRLTEDVCIRMPNLKVLFVSYDEIPIDCEASSYYCPHNLGSFTKLESLDCNFGYDPEWYGVSTNLTFPDSLEHLYLLNRYLHWEDLSMHEHLPRLGSLELRLVRGAEWDLADKEFRHLKVLRIASCYDLIHWNANRFHFPVLEMLCFSTVPELSVIPLDIGQIPTLRLIEVINCSMSAAISAMRIVVEQESLGNEDIQLDIRFVQMDEITRFKKTVEEEGLKINSLHLYQRVASKSKVEIDMLKSQLGKEFKMKYMGAAKKILGMEIRRERVNRTLFLSHKGYIERAKRFRMQNAKPVVTPLASHFRL